MNYDKNFKYCKFCNHIIYVQDGSDELNIDFADKTVEFVIDVTSNI